MIKPKKSRRRAKKVKGKVSVRTGAQIKRKTPKNEKYEEYSPTPLPHDNGATLKLRIKRK